MQIHIHIHNHPGSIESKLEEAIKLIIETNLITKKMSQELDNLNAKVDELQTTVDDVQQKIADRILADDAIIADLKAQIANGGATPAELQAVLDKVTAANEDLKATTV